jgi:hypothetical protein
MISFLIPTLRSEGLLRVKSAIEEHCKEFEYEILNRLAKRAKGEFLCVLGDDTIPQKGFIGHALMDMKELPDGWGLVAFDDGTHRPLATHFIVDKRVVALLGGDLLHSGYKHCFADNEITDRLAEVGRVKYSEHAVVIHDHPLLNGKGEGAFDDIYKRAYSRDLIEHDRDLFYRRKRHGWFKENLEMPTRVAVCIPSGDMIHADFAYALLNMAFHAARQGIQLGTVSQKGSLLPWSRCKLVEEARQMAATHMLFLDSDMLFPPETLVRLLSHKKGVICTDAQTRVHPYHSVVVDKDGERIKYNKDTPELVELAGGSTAVLLIEMDVFDKLPRPYFQLEHSMEAGFLGEDYFFTNLVRKHGEKFWCDTKLSREIGHIGSRAFYLKQEKV